MKKIIKIVVAALGLCVVMGIVFYVSRPYSDAVTISGLKRGAHGGAFVKSGGGYYELQSSDSFEELFAKLWNLAEEIQIRLSLSELLFDCKKWLYSQDISAPNMGLQVLTLSENKGHRAHLILWRQEQFLCLRV